MPSSKTSVFNAELADILFLTARFTRSPPLSTLASRYALRSLVDLTPEEFKSWQERRLRSAKSDASKAAPPPDDESLKTALSDLYAISEAAGLQIFIIFGTLLGAVRSGGVVPGDKDIDCGIIGRADFDRLTEQLKQSAFTVRVDRLKLGKLALRHPNGVPIDVKTFEPEEGGTWTWRSDLGPYRWNNRCSFISPLVRMNFLDINVWAPQQATDFLAWHYGPGWRKPTSDYHRLVGRETDEPELKDFIIGAAPYIAYRSLRNGKPMPARVIAERLCSLAPQDRLWPALLALLKHASP